MSSGKKGSPLFEKGKRGFCKVYFQFVLFLCLVPSKGGGTNSSSFLNIGDTFGPQVFLDVVIYITNDFFP